MDNRDSGCRILKERFQLNSSRYQRLFVGLMADRQNVGKIDHTGGIGVLKADGSLVNKRHGKAIGILWR